MNWFWKQWSKKCGILETFSYFTNWLASNTMCGIIHVRMEDVVIDQFTWSHVFKLHYVKRVIALASYINIPLFLWFETESQSTNCVIFNILMKIFLFHVFKVQRKKLSSHILTTKQGHCRKTTNQRQINYQKELQLS
jgi:hypothetical protein